MNKANECTCPSGDGSLRHPCPAHPAVEQAGTNVGHGHVFPRADGVKMRCGGPGLCSECSADAARARAALAQPSPAGEYGDAYQGAREDIAIWKRRALEAEQALRQAHNGQTFMGEPLVQPYEAPREKVNALFKVLGFSGTASVGDILDAALERLQAQPSPAQAEQHWPKLEKPAQVGAIRFSAGVSSRLVVEAAQRLYEFESTPEKEAERIERLQAFREQCFEPLGTEFSKVLSENLVELSSDAKPEQAEAERPEIVATLFTPNEKVHNVIGFKAFAVAGDCDKEGGEFYDPEKLMTVAQHARIVGALRAKADQLREALEWRAENQAGQRELLRSVKAERDAALAEVAGLRSLLNSLLCYVERDIDRMRSDRDKSDNKEIYDRSISLAMERLKAAQNAVFTTEPGCDTAVELAAQTTQAQHSVPGKYDDVLLPFLKSMEHELHANAGKGDRPGWLQMDRRTALLEIYYHLAKLQKATKDNDAAGIVEYAADVANMSMMLVDVCGLLAAAPGKEGV
ncbi:TPA: hypothetical protein ACGW1J_004494 [Pseudomonas aeruginosa]